MTITLSPLAIFGGLVVVAVLVLLGRGLIALGEGISHRLWQLDDLRTGTPRKYELEHLSNRLAVLERAIKVQPITVRVEPRVKVDARPAYEMATRLRDAVRELEE